MRFLTIGLTAALAALAMAPARAQTASLDAKPATVDYQGTLPPLIDRAIFFDDPEVSGGQLSPDGRYLTFMKPFNGERNVWIKGVDEPFDAARPLTANDRPIPGYVWSHDSEYVMFVQDAGGDENYHVYAVDPAAEPPAGAEVPEPRALTSGEGVRAMIYEIPRAQPGKIYVGLNDRDPAYHDLYAVDIATGEKTLVYENTEELGGYDFDNAGRLRSTAKSNDAGGTEIYAFGDGMALRKVYECTVDETCYVSGYTADDAAAYLVSNKGDVDKTGLYTLDPATGAAELMESDPEDEVDFGRAITSDSTRELLATVYTADKERIYWKNPEWEADYAFLREQLPGSEISMGSTTADERKMLVYANSDTDPGAAYLFDRDARTLELQYKPRPELPTADLAEMKPVRYASTDGLEIPAYLTLPKGVEPEGLPVVILVHGGPWARDQWGYNSTAQFLANRGYAVLSPNFRASTGFGKAFLNAGNGEWGEKMQDDITAGAEYLVAEGIADPARIGIMGGSYGGYATLAGLAFTPDTYAAGVDIVGPSNLITLLESIPPYWAAFRKQMYTRMADPDTEEGKAWLRERSPLNSATQIEAPLLVIQGANDPRVKQAEADQIVVALRDLDRPVEYLVAEDEGHGFRRPENNMAMYAATERFLAEHLGGRYQADMPDDIARRLAEITVDPAAVTLAEAPSEAELQAARPTPTKPLAEGARTYKMAIDMAGQMIEMDVTETVAKTDSGYVVTQALTSPMGEATDEIVLAVDDLKPVSRNATQGPVTVAMAYADDAVTGSATMGGNDNPIDATLDGPLFSDGGAEGLAIAALPLEAGFTAMLRGLDGQTFKPVMKRLEVTGTEQVEVPAATAEAYVVAVKPADGSAGETTYYVETGEAGRVLKVEATVPAMGGAKTTMVLVE